MSKNTTIYMDYPLRNYTGFASVYEPDSVGIEFEVEGQNLQYWDNKYWTCKEDGSLRQGFEWVVRRPVSISSIEGVIKNWFNRTNEVGAKISQSLRTSIHVHINCQHMTTRQIYTAITAYWLIENLLVRYSGPSREGNLFCLRAKDADYAVTELIHGIESGTLFQSVRGNEFKYAALNLQAITKYGTFEFRMMRGEYSDPKFINQWVQELYNFIQNTKKLNDPREVIRKFKNSTAKDFLLFFFSPEFVVQIMDEHDFAYAIMEENFHYAFALATCIPDWGVHKEQPKAEETPTLKLKKGKQINFTNYITTGTQIVSPSLLSNTEVNTAPPDWWNSTPPDDDHISFLDDEDQ